MCPRLHRDAAAACSKEPQAQPAQHQHGLRLQQRAADQAHLQLHLPQLLLPLQRSHHAHVDAGIALLCRLAPCAQACLRGASIIAECSHSQRRERETLTTTYATSSQPTHPCILPWLQDKLYSCPRRAVLKHEVVLLPQAPAVVP